jgi:hypothetical protein
VVHSVYYKTEHEDIYLPDDGDRPKMVTPPLSPPKECEAHLETREADTEQVVLKRLQVRV